MSESDDAAARPQGIRWWPAVAIVSLIGVTEWMAYLYFSRQEDTTFQTVSLVASSLLGSVLLAVWWLLFSRTGWRLRVGGFLLVMGLFAGLLRFEGFRGDLTPEVSFRWQADKAWEAAKPTKLNLSAGNGSVVNRFRAHKTGVADSPDFWGARRDGVILGHHFGADWTQPELLWRVPVGRGWGGTAVVGPLTWTMEQRDDREVVVCRDAETGDEVWTHEDQARFDEPMGGPGPRTTPSVAGELVFTLGATGILNCLEAATGKRRWSANILQDAGAGNLEWAMSGSPLVHGGNVIVAPGGASGASLIAYDRETGDRRWSGGDAIASYSSPQLALLRGREQVLVFNGRGVTGHEVEGGNVLWEFPWSTAPKINVAQPVVIGEGAVFLSAGYGKGAVMIDVSREDDRWSAEERWRSTRLKAKFNSFILHKGHIYGLDEGILVCVDASNGRRLWKDGRYGFGQMLLEPNGEVLVIQAESGEIVYVKASPTDHEEVGRFQAIEGKTWNHPTVANGCLFVRNDREAACYRLTGPGSGASLALE